MFLDCRCSRPREPASDHRASRRPRATGGDARRTGRLVRRIHPVAPARNRAEARRPTWGRATARPSPRVGGTAAAACARAARDESRTRGCRRCPRSNTPVNRQPAFALDGAARDRAVSHTSAVAQRGARARDDRDRRPSDGTATADLEPDRLAALSPHRSEFWRARRRLGRPHLRRPQRARPLHRTSQGAHDRRHPDGEKRRRGVSCPSGRSLLEFQGAADLSLERCL